MHCLQVCFLLLEEDNLVTSNQVVFFVPAIHRHLFPLTLGQYLLWDNLNGCLIDITYNWFGNFDLRIEVPALFSIFTVYSNWKTSPHIWKAFPRTLTALSHELVFFRLLLLLSLDITLSLQVFFFTCFRLSLRVLDWLIFILFDARLDKELHGVGRDTLFFPFFFGLLFHNSNLIY